MGRKILYVVGGVIVLVLLALVILPFVINVNQFRPQIEAAADSALNRKVMIGDIALSLLSGGVSVQDISVSDDPAFGTAPFSDGEVGDGERRTDAADFFSRSARDRTDDQ